MKALLTAALHAALGGFVAGFATGFAGGSFKVALAAGLGSAATSVFSLFTNKPKS